MKNKSSRRLPVYAILLGSVLIFIFFSHQTILINAGKYLAPKGTGKAAVVILEGDESIREDAIKIGLRLLYEGKANRMVVVLHQFSKDDSRVVLEEKYTQLISNELEHFALGKEKAQVIWAPIDGHPITLSEARFVVNELSKDNLRSALLLSKGFHTRRSFGVYNQEGERVGLHIIPYSYFTDYEGDTWWHSTQGISDFVEQSLKFAYYLLRGYVPIETLWYL